MDKPATRAEWEARASTLRLRTQAFVDGRFVDAASGKTFDCINPATGKKVMKYHEPARNQLANCMLLTQLENGAGGKFNVVGDFLFRTQVSTQVDGGLWGLLRVTP